MLDLKGLEAAARKLRNAEKEKFGSWPDADDSKSIAAATVTAYLQAVGPEPAVAVKPLEWEKPPHNESLSRAETDFGVYRAWTHFEAGGRWFWSLDGYQKASGEVSNEDEAKATCQADHDARISGRIRAALVATPPAAMTCDEQFALATKLAGDLGYDLVPEPPHPDTPVDNFSGQTTPPAEPVVREYAQERHDATPELGAFNAGFRRAMKNIVALCDAPSALVEPGLGGVSVMHVQRQFVNERGNAIIIQVEGRPTQDVMIVVAGLHTTSTNLVTRMEAEELHKALGEFLETNDDEAAGYAERLAIALWEKHYRNATPNWKPLTGDLIGILTQIDNMTSGLALATKPAVKDDEAVVALPNWNCWRSIDTAPEDCRVILATAGNWVGEAIMLRDEDTGEQVWTWVDTGKPSLHSCYGWMHLPDPLSAPVLSDLRPGGFDGPTGAE